MGNRAEQNIQVIENIEVEWKETTPRCVKE